MAYSVIYLSAADADALQIVDYIAVQLSNVTAAEDFIDELERKHRLIADTPYFFRKYDRLNPLDEEVRVAPVKNYNLFYSIRKTEIIVKRILHQRQDVQQQISE